MNEESSHLLPEGTLLQDGRYRVERRLSSGGFGNTYVVTNTRFNERWAMKEFFMKGVNEREGDSVSVSVSNVSQTQFETQRAKFNKEAQRLRKLRHRGIVHVEDLFDENGTSYYVMDYVGGGSLSEQVKQHGLLSEERVRQLLPEVLDALEYVHNQRMWHLDLKPGNILLDDQGHPVLIDFGASKQLGLGGGNSTSIGMTYTQGYAPSEQVDQNFERIGPWTDLYALGGTIYNLLTGKTPPSVSEIQEMEGEAFEFPRKVSEEMRKLVLWMMTPNRRKRPQSVQEVRDYLKLGASAVHTPVSDDEKTRKPDADVPQTPGKQWWLPMIQMQKGAIGALALLAVAFVVWWLWPKSAPKPDEPVAELITSVTDKEYTNPIGTYKYTGPVDSLDNPNGAGEANFADGRYYKGVFVHGTMQGKEVHFRMSNGDTFEGEFRDNRFYQGRYTVKEDGSYFEGTFQNGQPDRGLWYDKDGTQLAE